MSKISFTAGRIADATCAAGKQQHFIWDSETKGLGLRITAAGAKAYIYQGKLHGKSVRITLGEPSAWPIESDWGKDSDGRRVEIRRGARQESRRLQSLIDQGIDPRQEKADQRSKAAAAKTEATRKDLTIGEVWPLYLADRAPRWGDRHYVTHVSLAAEGGKPKKRGKGLTVSGPLYPLMSVRLTDLTANKIATWLDKEAGLRPTNAHQSYRIIRAFMNWAADTYEYKGLIPPDACSARMVRDVVPKSKSKEGDSLQREQLAAWFDAVRRIGNPVISVYLQALLLTGARREEMAALRWEDVNFQWRGITIRDKVNSTGGEDGTRTIPLTRYLSVLMSALPRRNEWVFSSPTAANGRLAEPRKAHNQALAAAGLPHVSIHGLRRSFGTLCEWVEMPAGISAQIMGHAPSALAEKHYRRRPLDLLRTWHDKIEAWVLEQAGIDFVPSEPSLRVVNSA